MTIINSAASKAFTPTPASIPPDNVQLTQITPKSTPKVYQNPLGFLLRAAQIYPDKLAIAHPDVPHPAFYSYSVWCQRVQNLAYALLEAGIKPGDRVAIIAPNTPMIADAHFGVLAARAIITPINTRLKQSEVSYILEHSRARLIICDYEYQHLVDGAAIPLIICNDTGRHGDPYEDFLLSGRRFSREQGWPGLESETDENVGAVLCYTSGTTGRPKGVITTLRGSYLAGIANAFEGQINRDSSYLWILPMFHAAGWTYPWANVFAFSTQITLRTVNYTLIWKHFLHSGVTHYCGAPTVQIGIVNDPDARKLPRPITAIIAGAAPTAHLIGELEKKGISPVHVYGLTETYGPFTRNYFQPSWTTLSLEARSKLMARQGHAFATAEGIRVVRPPEDPDNIDYGADLIDVPRDGKTVGEIVTRGNIVMKEVSRRFLSLYTFLTRLTMSFRTHRSISETSKPRRRHSVEAGSTRETLPSCIQMVQSPLWIVVRTSSFPVARYVHRLRMMNTILTSRRTPRVWPSNKVRCLTSFSLPLPDKLAAATSRARKPPAYS
ncbi:hypothetical protein HGRIS_007738 [Hohenbuehelia grisea]|uniref:AMP-dependent synthetase/ligase domain-containing protein n=1 Tax=Hohenbuehelia grisea TaxID=104357 RepID=A0ABR3J660_9AGAR